MWRVPSQGCSSSAPSLATSGNKDGSKVWRRTGQHELGQRKAGKEEVGRGEEERRERRGKKSVNFQGTTPLEKVKVTEKREELSVSAFRVTIKLLGKSRKKAVRQKQKPKAKGPPPGFNPEKMTTFLHQQLEEHLEDYQYDGGRASSKVKELTALILDQVKKQELGRYKYVCYLAIGDVANQGLEIATRCLSNTLTDNYVSATYESKGYYVVAVLHAIHFD